MLRPVSTLAKSGFVCEEHGCPRECFARLMPRPEIEHTACRLCSIEQACRMDEVVRRYYAALLKRALGPAAMADLLEVARDEGLAEDERILAGAFFTASLNGSDLGHTLHALVTHETEQRGIETLDPRRPN